MPHLFADSSLLGRSSRFKLFVVWQASRTSALKCMAATTPTLLCELFSKPWTLCAVRRKLDWQQGAQSCDYDSTERRGDMHLWPADEATTREYLECTHPMVNVVLPLRACIRHCSTRERLVTPMPSRACPLQQRPAACPPFRPAEDGNASAARGCGVPRDCELAQPAARGHRSGTRTGELA